MLTWAKIALKIYSTLVIVVLMIKAIKIENNEVTGAGMIVALFPILLYVINVM